jgi:Ser/Thr protein kinase RdoA (MazF antagonist)
MAQALTASRGPSQRLAMITEIVTRLRRDCDVTVKHVTWPGRELADWHSSSRTFYIAADATLDDQAWAIMELVLLLTVGPEACAGAHPTPILHLVPEPSDEPSRQPAS